MQFQNTKSDMGNCPKRYHEEKLREKFLSEGTDKEREVYEMDYMGFLEKLVNDLERKLRRGKDRLESKPNDPTAALNPISDEIEEKRTILDLQIKEALAKVEEHGEEGRIQEAQEANERVDRLKAELERLRQMEAENPAYRLEKKMEVCTTCGALLIVGDQQKRVEAHFEGRQHNGWALTREALAELKRKYASGYSRTQAQPEPGEVEDGGYDSYVPSADRNYRGRDDRDGHRGPAHHRDRRDYYDRDRIDGDRRNGSYGRDRDRDRHREYNHRPYDRRTSTSPQKSRRY